jgi:two-component system chemotaxis response regulator CheB
MQVEQNFTLALSVDEKVHYSRPSIDVLFESCARAYKSRFLGVLLSGANEDGANGLVAIRDRGGITVAQTPATAEQPVMPQSAIDRAAADIILAPGELCRLFQRLHHDPRLSAILPENQEARQ